MDQIVLPIVDKIVDAVLPESTSSSKENSTPIMPMVPKPLASTDGTLLSTQPLPSAPTPVSRSPLGDSVVIPFQFLLFELDGTQNASKTYSYSEITPLKNIITPYRDAVLSHLDAVVYPTALAYSIPTTVDLAWTTDDVKVTENKVLATPGAAKVTVGGVNLLNSAIVSCDLNYINPIVKSPITYSNLPRINIKCYKSNAQATAGNVTASIIVRGSVRCSHPILVPNI